MVAKVTAKVSRGTLVGAAAGILLALGVVCALFVWTRAGQQVDQNLLSRSENWPTGPASGVLAALDDPVVLAALLGVVLAVGAVRGRWGTGLAAVGITLGSVAAAKALKLLVPRPDLDVIGSTTHNSFPSGHVAAATGLVLAFLVVLPPRARWWVAVPGGVAVVLVALATMVAGWHRLSDVLGGVLLAAAVCALVTAALRLRPAL